MVSFSEMKQYQKLAVGGAVLAIVSLFLPVASASALGVTYSLSGLDAIGANWIGIGLLLAVLAILNEILGMNNEMVRTVYLGLGALGILWVLYDIISAASTSVKVSMATQGMASAGLSIGAYTMLLALILFVVSGWKYRQTKIMA